MSFVTFGEIMLRLTPDEHAGKLHSAKSFDVNYAGSESNVASSLAILGNGVKFVSKLPQNPVADGAIRSLKSYGVDTSAILRGGARMGTYFIELGSSLRPSQVTYDRRHSAFSTIGRDEFNWEAVLSGATYLFVSGITAALSDSCAHALLGLTATARKMGVRVAFDFNYRRTLWDSSSRARALFDGIMENTDLLFGNSGGMTDVYGMEAQGGDRLVSTQQLMLNASKAFGIKQLAFTMRDHTSATKNEVSAIFLDGSNFFCANTYAVDVLDRFGTGDAFAAGFLHAYEKNWEKQQVIDFATAAFALKHTIRGDQHTSSEEEILSIMEGNIAGHVIR